MGDGARGEAAWWSDDLRKAMGICADQLDEINNMQRIFAPAELSKRDFGLAPGADAVADAYVDDLPNGRYPSLMAYLRDLSDAFTYISAALGDNERTYQTADQGSTIKESR
ncbi:hypothetical protein ABZ297_09025 [Nonomuraea sp. NPDC005983]|uniref:hypothetical protein n=1 Tax=Nonomuraea sp. NPDC005983 TaxID=3155595 RepID=UPI0033A9F630